jgi:hypothetical protein
MNNENEEEIPKEEESFTKTSNNMEYQIDNLKKEFEFQNQQKNKEIEILFNEINNENQELKKELLETKLELEDERQKSLNIKNTFLNINSNNLSNYLQPDIKIPEKNYIYLNDHIKIIKENSEKKITELNNNKNSKQKNFEEEKNNSEKNIKKILALKKDTNETSQDIMEILEKFWGEIDFLMNENFNKDKYIITLGEKYEIIKEEIHFLKERIFQEKINILEKINELEGLNKLNHVNLIQELQQELENNNKNFYNEQILGPLENINLMISSMKDNEREIESNRYKLECENEILKNKIDILEKEKNELLNKSSNFIFDKESIISENMINKSQVNKLNKENQLLKNENDNLLKNIKDLNEELFNIKNKYNFDIKKIENNYSIILSQKENAIKELSSKNDILLQNYLNSKNELNELNEQIINLQQKISAYEIKENEYKNELRELNKELNTQKNLEQKYSFTEQINKKPSNFLNKDNININNINTEYNKVIKELNEVKGKNIQMQSELNQLKNNKEILPQVINQDNDLLQKILKLIKEIYQLHFNNKNSNIITDINNNNNNNKNLSDEILILLQTMKETSPRNSESNNQEIIFNKNFADLENNKNSQLYENILLYLVNIKSQNKIESAKRLSEKNSEFVTNNNSGEISQSMTHNSSSNYFNKKYFDELKFLLEDKYHKLEQRIRQSITIGELEELFIEFKNLYEAVIDSIIQSFYIYKTDLSENNILTIQMPLDKYHQIINNANSNLISIDKSLYNKINDYKSQGEKIESALSILIKNVNAIY